MGIALITPPVEEPISVAEARVHLRTTGDDEESLIQRLIGAARRYYERVTRRQLVTATWELSIARFPYGSPISNPWKAAVQLPRSPLAAVISVKYLDLNGTQQTLDPSIYDVDKTVEPGVVRLAYGKMWPSVRMYPGAILIRFDAGYGTAIQVPDEHKAVLGLLIGHLYEHREAVGSGTIFTQIPLGLEMMIWANKVPEAA